MVLDWNLGWPGTERKAVSTGGKGPICECTRWSTLEGSVQGGELDAGGLNFQSIKLTN